MNLNPFDLRGPEFLLLYVCLLAGCAIGLWALRRWHESEAVSQEKNSAKTVANDPYAIAYLRGGPEELLRTAVVALLERGLLLAEGANLRAVSSDAAEKRVQRPLDKAILTKFAQGGKAQSLFEDGIALAEVELVREALEEQQLLPGLKQRQFRMLTLVLATALLWLIGGVKMYVALQRGRTNILFLVLLAASCPFILYAVSHRFRTRLGDRVCARIEQMFHGLRERAQSLRMLETTSELTYLAAIFGTAALPYELASNIDALHLHRPQPPPSASSGCGSSCGSSSCGGGCGGGCGGCGS